MNGVLPAPDRVVGGHAIVADGWTPQGLGLLNSWGPAPSVALRARLRRALVAAGYGGSRRAPAA